eukprot:357523-Chlamydomonas_euryale.AAC.6
MSTATHTVEWPLEAAKGTACSWALACTPCLQGQGRSPSSRPQRLFQRRERFSECNTQRLEKESGAQSACGTRGARALVCRAETGRPYPGVWMAQP